MPTVVAAVMAVIAAMMAAVMAMAPMHLLRFGTREVILIRNRGLGRHVRLGLRAVHQIMMRGQHRSSTRRCGNGCDSSCAGGDA